MPRPPKLTDQQKQRLHILEPSLRNAVKVGDYETAKAITYDIQKVLRPTGHETRLMRSKNWLFEAAMEAGKLGIAKTGFDSIRRRVSNTTRIYLEATSLLAICYLREGEIEEAKPYMAEVLKNDKVIRSKRTRREFKKQIIERFEEEGTLAVIRGKGREILNADEIQDQAGLQVTQRSDEELYTALGEAVPSEAIAILLQIDGFARKQLTRYEVKLLPSPETRRQRREIGKTVFAGFKRVLWRSLCDAESEIYKAWFERGMMFVLNKKYLTTAIIAAMSGLGIGIKALAVSATALVMKMGIETYCEAFKPVGVMQIREKKSAK